jgi:hypothetical protein
MLDALRKSERRIYSRINLAFVHFGDEPDEGVAASGVGHDYNSKHYWTITLGK